MRYFIALEIPPESIQEIAQVQQKLKAIFPQLRLTDPQKLHLTIAFIGEQPDDFKQPLTGVLEKAAIEVSPFSVTPAYVDGFPNLHHAHIFWLGIKGDIDKLMILRERVKDGLINLGLESDERRYVPHIAIGKIDNLNLDQNKEEQLEKVITSELSPIQITAIKLFESILQHGFHQHNTLAEIPLEI